MCHTFSWHYYKIKRYCIAIFELVQQNISQLPHWGRVTQIYVGKLTIIGSDNSLSPGRRQAIIWTNARILLIGPLGRNFSGVLIWIQTFSLKKIRLKMSSAKCCPFRFGPNVSTKTSDHISSPSNTCINQNAFLLLSDLTGNIGMI